jgi:hypothetical protein
VRVRTLGAVVAAVLALAGLTACRTNVGTAATVDGQRITESDVNRYVTHAGPDKTYIAQVSQNGGSVPSPRSFVLGILLREKVFERTLASLGSVPSEGQLSSYRADATNILSSGQTSAADSFEAAVRRGLPKLGVSSKFSSAYMRVGELEYAIVKAKNSNVAALVKQAGIRISVSPRYGAWDPNQVFLRSGPALPSYLTVQGSTSPAAQPGG